MNKRIHQHQLSYQGSKKTEILMEVSTSISNIKSNLELGQKFILKHANRYEN